MEDTFDRAFPHYSDDDQARLELLDKRLELYPNESFQTIVGSLAMSDYDFEQRIKIGVYIPRQNPSYSGTRP
jgi:hypothetical protein